jgi:hypothetical protein
MESLRTVSKESNKVPKGAKILKKEKTVTIEEIENGFIVSSNFDIRYKLPDSEHTEYAYYTKKWYSKENPVEINVSSEDKSLADAFE